MIWFWFLDVTCAVESIMTTKLSLRVKVWLFAHVSILTSSYLLRCWQQNRFARLRGLQSLPPPGSYAFDDDVGNVDSECNGDGTTVCCDCVLPLIDRSRRTTWRYGSHWRHWSYWCHWREWSDWKDWLQGWNRTGRRCRSSGSAWTSWSERRTRFQRTER